MKSRWHDKKETAISLRKAGTSINDVEKQLGIPRSTLSGWFKSVTMDDTHIARLQKRKEEAWARARINSALTHRQQKADRLHKAHKEAASTLKKIEVNNEILELAFAMLYLGEGAKSGGTSLASSESKILRFVLTVLTRVYSLDRSEVRCDLHLRMDQNEDELKNYWSRELHVPIENFKYTAYDKRSVGKPTFSHYKGVCVVSCGKLAIQRKLIALYNQFLEKVASLESGT